MSPYNNKLPPSWTGTTRIPENNQAAAVGEGVAVGVAVGTGVGGGVSVGNGVGVVVGRGDWVELSTSGKGGVGLVPARLAAAAVSAEFWLEAGARIGPVLKRVAAGEATTSISAMGWVWLAPVAGLASGVGVKVGKGVRVSVGRRVNVRSATDSAPRPAKPQAKVDRTSVAITSHSPPLT